MSELIGKYPNASNTIKRIFDFDTPEGKYSSWIAKNLVNDFEFYGGSYLSPTQLDLILSWYRDLPYFERNYVRLTPEILEISFIRDSAILARLVFISIVNTV